MARWQTLSQGVSSNDRVKTLLKELERLSQGDLGTAEYFEGQVRAFTTLTYNMMQR